MKKTLCVVLAILLTFALIACGEGDNSGSGNPSFKIGYGKVDVTPDLPVNLASYGDSATRISQGWLHALEVIAIVMTDADGETMVMITTDLSQGSHPILNTVRPMILERFGIPEDHIVIGGTHNHNAPDYGYNSEGIKAWMEEFHEGILTAVQIAMDDRAPAVAEIGRTETEGMTFVRRYLMDCGCYNGDNGFCQHSGSNKELEHESEADEEIQIVRFIREGDHKDIIMANWQAHAAKHGHTSMGSADFPGEFRDALAKEMDAHCVFYQGACGNLNPTSRLPGECVVTKGGYDGAKEVGQRLAEYVKNALTTDGVMKRINVGDIKVKRDQFVGSMQGWDEANAITCGDLSFVTLPAEFYDNLGVDLKSNDYFEMTVLMGFHCGNGQYLPSNLGWQHGGYGPSNSRYRPGDGERFVEFYLNMLKELSGK